MRSIMQRAVIAVTAGVLVAAAVVRPASAQGASEASRSIQAQPGTSRPLAAVLTRSCGDCHSRTMAPGWYTKAPLFSTIMTRAARKGRKSVDFSEWTGYSPDQQRAFLAASCADATAGTMPMPAYLRFRPEARLSPEDIATICSASRSNAITTAASAPQPAGRIP
ncbi:MAG TPA: heme-binding domain-containing protein [Gemmatimonadaceae bacterium]|jgi:hypothetical protein